MKPCSGCGDGWSGDGETCTDLNECEERTHECAYSGGICVNTEGTYICRCDDGWDGDGVKCDDIDECTLGSHNCEAGIACRNNDGGFGCGDCANGFQLTAEGSCEDIDECYLGVHSCANPGGTCINNEGSYTCPGISRIKRYIFELVFQIVMKASTETMDSPAKISTSVLVMILTSVPRSTSWKFEP